MALLGAEILFYPTAIGDEPHDASLDTMLPWRRAMQGHAVSNVIPILLAASCTGSVCATASGGGGGLQMGFTRQVAQRV